jgi:hypothetical protein
MNDFEQGHTEQDFNDVEVLINESEIVDTTLPLKSAIEPTGDSRVDSALERLADSESLPMAEQIQVFEDVHRKLQDALSDLA